MLRVSDHPFHICCRSLVVRCLVVSLSAVTLSDCQLLRCLAVWLSRCLAVSLSAVSLSGCLAVSCYAVWLSAVTLSGCLAVSCYAVWLSRCQLSYAVWLPIGGDSLPTFRNGRLRSWVSILFLFICVFTQKHPQTNRAQLRMKSKISEICNRLRHCTHYH